MLASAKSLTEQAPSSLLRDTGLGRYLTEGQLRALERHCRASVRQAGATLFRQGEPAESFCLLLRGSVELRARPPGRRAFRTIEVVLPPCPFGDEALFGGDYRAAARTLEITELLTLSRPAFERLSEEDPAIASGLLRYAGACLLQSLRRSAILTHAPADVSLRALLSELASARDRVDGGAATLRITHAQLAGVLHLSRETVSRMLGHLAEEGAVQVGRGVIRFRRG
jgi:CRP-like cAMP-binding protein